MLFPFCFTRCYDRIVSFLGWIEPTVTTLGLNGWQKVETGSTPRNDVFVALTKTKNSWAGSQSKAQFSKLHTFANAAFLAKPKKFWLDVGAPLLLRVFSQETLTPHRSASCIHTCNGETVSGVSNISVLLWAYTCYKWVDNNEIASCSIREAGLQLEVIHLLSGTTSRQFHVRLLFRV